MDIVDIHVPTRKITEFFIFCTKNALIHSPSVKYVITANDTCRFLDSFGNNTASSENIFSILEGVHMIICS
jgi:hypothetical protein